MDIKLIKGNAAIVETIIAQWELTGELSDLERKLLLSKLEELTAAVNRSEIVTETKSVEGVEADAEDNDGLGFSIEIDETPVVEEQESEETDDVPDLSVPRENISIDEVAPAKDTVEEAIEALSLTLGKSEPEPVADEIAEEVMEDETQEETEEVEVEEKKVSLDLGQGRRGRVDRRKIRSLYEDDAEPEEEAEQQEEETVEEVTEPIVEEEKTQTPVDEEVTEEIEAKSEVKETENRKATPSPEHKKVLGEVINQGTQVLGETITQPTDVAARVSAERVTGLRKAIGVNDKYIMIRDLFAGDEEAYESAISSLDEIYSLEDAMLWIYDNYDWEPECDAAKLLVDILVRKLS